MEESLEVVKEILNHHSVAGTTPDELERSRNLLDEGIIDSLALMTLLAALEERYGIEFDAEEVVPDNFRTVAAIAALVDRKRAGQR